MTRRAFIKRGALFVPAFGIAKASAQNLINPYRFAAGGGGYAASNADFDGTSDYMSLTSSGPTGLADGKQLTFSTWIRLAINSAWQTIFDASTASAVALRHIIRVNDDNTILVYATNSSATEILRITTTNTITTASGWVHLYVCIDLADTAKRKIYFNGTPCTLTVTTYSDDTIDFVGTNYVYRIGAKANGGIDKLAGVLSETWFDDSYLDDTTKFASGGCPISLGSDGSTPTGAAPVFYFKGSGNGFNVNSGTGGNFTVTGSLGTFTGPC